MGNFETSLILSIVLCVIWALINYFNLFTTLGPLHLAALYYQIALTLLAWDGLAIKVWYFLPTFLVLAFYLLLLVFFMYSDLQDKKTTKELLKKYEGKTVPKIFTFSGTNEVWAVDVPEAKMLALKYTSDFRNPVGIFLNIFGCEWHWAEEEGTDMDKVETRFNLLKREEEKDAKNALNDEELMEIAECFFEKSEVGVFSLSLDRNSKMKLAKELEEIGFVLIEKPKFKESIKEYHNFLLVKKNNELAEKGERLAWTSQSDL